MDDDQWLAARFEEHRARLRAVAYRMLGSLSDADDAVQDTWLRLARSGTDQVDNLGGWLTTIVARVCLSTLSGLAGVLRAVELRPALVNGAAGVVVTVRGRPLTVMGFTVGEGRIVEIDAIADPERLQRIAAPVLHDG